MRLARLSGPAAPLIGAAAGLLAAGVVTLLQDSTYRADASIVLVRQGQPPGSDPALAAAADTAAELFDTRAVAASAIGNLGLDLSPDALVDRLSVTSETSSSLVRIEVEAETKERARRIAQEVAEVSSVLFNDRFGPETVASVWEPASAEDDAVAPDPGRNLALGALLGALAATLLGSFARGPARFPPIRLPRLPTPRPRPQPPSSPAQGPAPAAPAPAAAPAPSREPVATAVIPAAGDTWTVAAVERLIAEHGGGFPELQAELELYAGSFRDVAAADGSLPAGVGVVVEDVFAPLIEQARLRG